MAISFSRPDPEAPSPSSTSDSFRITRRGFDPDEVRASLRALRGEVESLKSREHDLARELSAAQRPQVDLESISDELLAELVGEEAARLLREARDTVALARTRAEEEAVQIVAAAYEEAARVRDAVQEEVTYLQRTTADQVETELASARGRGLEMVTEAREYREKVLADLAKRRELAREQIRALLDGRDHLLRAFEVARLAAVDVIVELEQAAPHDAVNPAEGALDQDVFAPSIYDADADITPATGLPVMASERAATPVVPATSGPVVLEAIIGGQGADGPAQGSLFDTPKIGIDVGAAIDGGGAPEIDAASTNQAEAAAAPNEFGRRQRVLEPLADSLAKQLRRVALDEQNDVLAAVRRSERVQALAELLPEEEAHLERYHACVLAEVADAFAAGAVSMGASVPAESIAMNAAVVARIAEELVLPMRERLERVIESSEGNRFELSAFVRSSYREWKQRFDNLAEEILVLAHGYGAYEALPAGTLVVWQPDPEAAVCAEVAANIGVVTRVPDVFPSGHHHPPASSTCRCLIQRVPE